MRLFSHQITEVDPQHIEGLLRLCATDPVAGVSLAHQLRRWPRWGSGDVVAVGPAAHPSAGAWAAGSLIVFGTGGRPEMGLPAVTRSQAQAMADHARRRLTATGSVMGPRQDVEAIWHALTAAGTRAREERWNQPVLIAPSAPCDPSAGSSMTQRALRRHRAVRGQGDLEWVAGAVRPAAAGEEGHVLPASVDMFIGELGYDPTRSGGSYARNVEWLVARGRTYVLLDDGAGDPPADAGSARVAFKADVGALWTDVPGSASGVAQLTGVWTRPDLRGRGIGTVALGAVIDAVRREHVGAGGTVSLYVNDFNEAALSLYRGLGMTQAGTFATILL